MITSEYWYDPSPDLTDIYQGDILDDVPFAIFPTYEPDQNQKTWGFLRPRPEEYKGRPLQQVMANLPIKALMASGEESTPNVWENPDGEYLLGVIQRKRVLLVSRTCDMAKTRRAHYLIAPVSRVADLNPDQRTPAILEVIRNDDYLDRFYLPEGRRIPESFADLSKIVFIHKSFIRRKELKDILRARLSSCGLTHLQVKISNHMGSIFGFNATTDLSPQDATYACSVCFFSGALVGSHRYVPAGKNFGPCNRCGERALWVKLPDKLPLRGPSSSK